MKICPSPVFFEPVAILAKICPSFFQKVLNFGYHIFRNWCPYVDTCTFHILDTIFSETGALTSILTRFIFWIPYFQKLVVPLCRYLHVSYFGYHETGALMSILTRFIFWIPYFLKPGFSSLFSMGFGSRLCDLTYVLKIQKHQN
jgi:hypothetical protein